MHFALTEEQIELAKAVRGLVERRAGSVDLHAAIASEAGYDTALWSDLVEQIGVAALAIPEEFGGAGFSSFETHVVLEQLGYSLSPSPLLGSGVLAAQSLMLPGDAVDADARERILGEIAGGTVAALAWADARGTFRTDGSDVVATGDALTGHQISGQATLVLEGADAEILLVVAENDGVPALFEVAPDAAGLTREATGAMDQTLRLATLTFASAPATLVASQIDLAKLRAVAAIATTALQVGGAQACLDRTVAYLKEREQFERTLGSFQALKHRVADMLVAVESARSMSWAAGWAASVDAEDLVTQAALATSWCTDSFNAVAGETIQLHGGIAITWEHDAHLYFKRAHATAQLFGRAHEHRQALVEA